MKLVIEVDIITDVPAPAHDQFAKYVVEMTCALLNDNSIIQEALDHGARFNTTARAGRRSVRVESNPVIYGVTE